MPSTSRRGGRRRRPFSPRTAGHQGVVVLGEDDWWDVSAGNRRPPRRRRGDLPSTAARRGRTAEHIIAEQERRRRGRTFYRLRWHLVPHYAAVALLVLAGLGWVTNWATHDDYAGSLALGGGALIVTGLAAVWLVRGGRLRRWRWHRRATLAAAFGAAWLTVALWTGWTWDAMAVLCAAELTFGAGYWRTIRISGPTSKPLPDAGEEPEPEPPIYRRWADNVACDGGVAPKSRLSGREVDDITERYTVELVRGKQSIRTIEANLDKVYSGLGHGAEEVIVEPHPSRDPARLALTIVHTSPVRDTVVFNGPQYFRPDDHSWIEIGPYADGTSRVRVPVYAPNSIRNLTIIGGQGSGKSALLNAAAVSLKASGHTVVIYLDGQDGVSSPQLLRYATWAPTGEDRELVVLEALERVYAVRGKLMKKLGVPGLNPSGELPGVMVVVDECHVFWRHTSKHLDRWERLIRTGRKVGVGFWAATQHPAVESFGNDKIRSLLQQYTTLVLRTAGAVAQNILRIKVNPADLPTEPGYGYVIGGTESVRTAPFRADFLDDKNGDADAMFEAYPGCDLDKWSTKAAGDAFIHRAEIAVRQRQELEDELAEWESDGDVGDDLLASLGSMAQEDAVLIAVPALGPVPTFPPPPTLRVIDGGQAAQETPGAPSAREAVYAALAGGATTPTQVMEATGYGKTQVWRALRSLEDDSKVTNPARGTYRIADQPTREEGE
ncbi:hypothetical protein [Actinopolymorpha pittospori]|uniref:FtsK domain-containing protein n=1 Tax=Actinopolymorpha pittospori TaxID=648752 RepID=A0A927MPF9_9ACTN|nr:hypothetical protein [Actinopolymorpha pittospori]MBE1603757.1 hypothetical protein [Actinopolymorpha pittospori]